MKRHPGYIRRERVRLNGLMEPMHRTLSKRTSAEGGRLPAVAIPSMMTPIVRAAIIDAMPIAWRCPIAAVDGRRPVIDGAIKWLVIASIIIWVRAIDWRPDAYGYECPR
jgi:hypothetical protein